MRNLFSLLLIAPVIISLLSFCYIWEQLGQTLSGEMLSSYGKSPHLNQETQVFENRTPDILEKMIERIDWRLTLEYFPIDSFCRAPDKPLPEVSPPGLKSSFKTYRFDSVHLAGTFQIADEYPKQTGFCLIQSSPILQPL